MEDRDMLRMANQIAGFFRGYGAEAAQGEIAAHINSFWEPRMRRLLFAYVDGGGTGLDPLVMAAVANGIKRPADSTAAT